ncbi:uncharacterized protein LOC121773376 [Salvia splendens]|nr:uncharacterized protein LOC121773376 [Salvia splendens]XP_042026160.1 uncharacterized protein LOC121773376 [Salvia splendens]
MPYMKFIDNDLDEMFNVRYKPPPRGSRYKKWKTIAGAESLKRRRWERTVSSDTDETGHSDSEHGEQERSEANDHAGHSGQPNTQGEDIESRMRTVLFDDSPTGVLALLVQKIGDWFEHRQHEQSALLVQKIDDRINQWFERRQHEQSALLDQKIDDRINQWFERRQHEQSTSHHSARDELHIPTETKLDADSADRKGRDEVHIPAETKLDAGSTDWRGRDEVHIRAETKLGF